MANEKEHVPTPGPGTAHPKEAGDKPVLKAIKRGALNLLDGPDPLTAQPVEGSSTVMTSLGELDEATVVNNRVGGVGVVHMHTDEALKSGHAPTPVAAPSPTAVHHR